MAISLLPPDLKETRKIGIGNIYRFFTMTLVIYVLCALIFGAFILFFKKRGDDVRLLYDAEARRIDELANVESADVIVKDRLKSVRAEIQTIPTFKTTFEKVFDITVGDTELEILEVSSDPQRIRISVLGEDSFAIERFLENSQGKFLGMTFDSLTLQEEKYIVDLLIPLKR